MAKVWVVAQNKSFGPDGFALDWDLGGIFSTEAKAKAVCTEPGDSYWPVEVDEFLGRETTEPPGHVMPLGMPG